MPSLILDQLDTYGPEHCESLTQQEAEAYNRELVLAQYENFSVISFMVPKNLRGDFANVYAFCRWADDLGDETGDPEESLRLLQWWRDELNACYAGKSRHPVFVGLSSTIEKHDIPSKPFEDLIDAFIQDQHLTMYQSIEDVLDYCTRSADPVGRLVLYMLGYRDETRQLLSDQTCTALQLANFWQDVRRDILERERVYVPENMMQKHGISQEKLISVVNEEQQWDPQEIQAWNKVMKELCLLTEDMFQKGRQLLPTLKQSDRGCIELFSLGGESVLNMIKKQGYDTWRERPSLSKFSKALLAMKVLLGKTRGWVGNSKIQEPDSGSFQH